jgi:hypothetical protein
MMAPVVDLAMNRDARLAAVSRLLLLHGGRAASPCPSRPRSGPRLNASNANAACGVRTRESERASALLLEACPHSRPRAPRDELLESPRGTPATARTWVNPPMDEGSLVLPATIEQKAFRHC